MKNQQIATAFAYRRSANATNLHTDGKAIYSYTTMIAKHFNTCTLMDSDFYSMTTRKHQSYIKYECNGLHNLVEVTNCNPQTPTQHRENINFFNEVLAKCWNKIQKCRTEKTRKYWQDLQEITKANKATYIAEFGL